MRKQLFTFSAVFLMAIAAVADEDWRLHGGSQTNQRFSPLNQINDQTVSRLGLVWSQELGTSTIRGFPVNALISSVAMS